MCASLRLETLLDCDGKSPSGQSNVKRVKQTDSATPNSSLSSSEQTGLLAPILLVSLLVELGDHVIRITVLPTNHNHEPNVRKVKVLKLECTHSLMEL